MGLATANAKDEGRLSGSATGQFGSTSDFGFTWEVSPSLYFGNLNVGVRAAGFPTVSSTSSVDEFKSIALGAFVGAAF